MSLLAAEITAVTGRTPSMHYADIEDRFGKTWYQRKDLPGTPEQKAAIAAMTPEKLPVKELAGAAIVRCETKAAGNGASIGGIKISTSDGWIAMRPSGTENICKAAEQLL